MINADIDVKNVDVTFIIFLIFVFYVVLFCFIIIKIIQRSTKLQNIFYDELINKCLNPPIEEGINKDFRIELYALNAKFLRYCKIQVNLNKNFNTKEINEIQQKFTKLHEEAIYSKNLESLKRRKVNLELEINLKFGEIEKYFDSELEINKKKINAKYK